MNTYLYAIIIYNKTNTHCRTVPVSHMYTQTHTNCFADKDSFTFFLKLVIVIFVNFNCKLKYPDNKLYGTC